MAVLLCLRSRLLALCSSLMAMFNGWSGKTVQLLWWKINPHTLSGGMLLAQFVGNASWMWAGLHKGKNQQ